MKGTKQDPKNFRRGYEYQQMPKFRIQLYQIQTCSARYGKGAGGYCIKARGLFCASYDVCNSVTVLPSHFVTRIFTEFNRIFAIANPRANKDAPN